jgi:phosphate transport system substrate-binding protein
MVVFPYNLQCCLTKRKAMHKYLPPYLPILALITILLSSCGSASVTATPVPTEQKSLIPTSSSGSIQISGVGATFPLPIYTEWMYAYSFVDPTVTINYQGIGSGAGKRAIIDGTIDFAGSDSLLTAQEYVAGKDLQMYPVLAGGVVVIYNFKPSKEYPLDLKVPSLVLDRQTLVEIYNGSINRWNDPKIIALNDQLADYLPDAAITVVYRSDTSGTTELFTKSLAAFSPTWTARSATASEWPVDAAENSASAKGNQGMAEVVINTANSLGYIELTYALSNNLAYADMIDRAGYRVTANAESVASAANDFGSAAFNYNLTATIVDGKGVGSWPISGYTYLILHQTSMTDCVKARKLLQYFHWTLTSAAAGDRAAKHGYAVLPEAVRYRVLVKLSEVTCKGQPVME